MKTALLFLVRILVLSSMVLAGAACKPRLTEDSPGEWRRWRGPNGQGVSQETGLPEAWSEDSANIRWKTRIPGAGNSSPIASHGAVFLTTTYGTPEDDWEQTWQRDELHRVVLKLDLKTGELLWQTPIFFGVKGKVHYTNTRATPTPVTDGQSVFVTFDGILAAVGFDGQILWKQDVDPDYYLHSHYGVSSSPIVTGDAVILMQDQEEGDSPDKGWIAAFDKATGEQLWRDEWDHTCCSYTTPILLDRGEGNVELVSSSAGEAVGYDPHTGKRLWTAMHRSSQPVPSLVTQGDLLCAPGAMHKTALYMFRLAGRGEGTEAELLWETKRGVPKIPTPLFYQGRLFVLSDQRVLSAYEPETGDLLWRGRVSPGDYWPSLVAGDGKLYAINQYGVVSVVDAGSDKFELLAANALGEGNKGATPAIAGGCLLVRTQEHLFCIEAAAPENQDG